MTQRKIWLTAILVATFGSGGSLARAQCGDPTCCGRTATFCAPCCALTCDTVDVKKTIYASESDTVCQPRLCLMGGLRDVLGRLLQPAHASTSCGDVATCEPSCGPSHTPLFGITCGKPYIQKKLLIQTVTSGSRVVYKCEPGGGCDVGCGPGDMSIDQPIPSAEPTEPATAKAAVHVPPVPRPLHGAMMPAPLPSR